MSLKPKFGICKEPSCLTPGQTVLIVSGRCTPCRAKRFKGYSQPKPRTERPTKPRKSLKRARKSTGELRFFQELWEDEKNRPHVSFLSGRAIKYFNPRCFAHVLPKGNYGKWRLNPDNIVYLTPDEHYDQHNIAISDLLKRNPRWAKFFDLQEELRIKYNNESRSIS